MKSKAKSLLKIIITIVLVVGSVYYSLHNVDLGKLWHSILKANYWWAVAAVPVILLSHWLRALRWRTLLKPVKEPESMQNLFSAVMIGYAVNNITPRGGELIRPLTYSKREKVPLGTVMATVLVERFIDVLSLLVFIAVAFLVVHEKIKIVFPDITFKSVFFAVILPTIILLAILVLSVATNAGEAMLRRLVRPFSENLYNKLHRLLESFIHGLAILKSPSAYAQIIFETLGIWILYILPMYIMFFAFDFQSRLHLGIADATFILLIQSIGVTLAPTPGAIGIYHTLVKITMMNFYGLSEEESLAYATVTHAVGYILTMVVGGYYAMHENIKGFEPRGATGETTIPDKVTAR
ncbi:MAG: lysylphosphatidylglycerol synthase transmembrane domain-containing protein [Bacteroidota bacterium]